MKLVIRLLLMVLNLRPQRKPENLMGLAAYEPSRVDLIEAKLVNKLLNLRQ